MTSAQRGWSGGGGKTSGVTNSKKATKGEGGGHKAKKMVGRHLWITPK